MEKNQHNIEKLPRDNRGGYRIPDGYFSALNRNIIEKAESTPIKLGFWSQLRTVNTYATSLAAITLTLIVGYSQFKPENQPANDNTELDEYAYFVDLYGITTEDLIDMQTQNDRTESQLFADAALEYIDLSGGDITYIE